MRKCKMVLNETFLNNTQYTIRSPHVYSRKNNVQPIKLTNYCCLGDIHHFSKNDVKYSDSEFPLFSQTKEMGIFHLSDVT